MMDGESRESTVENEVAGVGRAESESRVDGERLSESSRKLIPETAY